MAASKDINVIVGGFLRDLAFAQSSSQQMFGYKRAAAAILSLDTQLTELMAETGELPRIRGIGPASARVIGEVIKSGISESVEAAVAKSPKRADILRRRKLRGHFISRAETNRVLANPRFDGLSAADYRGDLQMHSRWSDGSSTLSQIADACLKRGYAYSAVTDHSYGLKIAGGMSMAEARSQRKAIDKVNAKRAGRFRLLQGIEANIGVDGALDLTTDEAKIFDLVLAAPHSQLRKAHDQTQRMLAAVRNPAVRILAHPRGRMFGSRAGVIADWDAVFAEAASRDVAVEIDGDPSRQDLDHTMAKRALKAGCLFALDSDSHTTGQLWYSEIALAHARLARIPPERVVNCWPLERLMKWLRRRR
jgi:putative hydrolase